MFDPKERLMPGVSNGELERRWALARSVMRERKIDYLVVRGDEEFVGGYVRWFTDIPARSSVPYTAIFPVDEEMTLITMGPSQPGEPGPPAWAVRGVKKRLSAPYFPSAHFTAAYDAELAVGVLKEKKNAVIGFVAKNFISTNFHDYVVKHLPGCTFVEVTEEIDQLMAVKSPEEQALIQATALMQDAVMAHLKKTVRPGMKDADVFNEAAYASFKGGSSEILILAASGPKGMPVPFAPRTYQNRTIREGDQLSVLVEVNGPGGFYTEIARIFSFGPPSQELVDAFAYSLEAQNHSLNLLQPGAQPRDILEANNEFLGRKGYKPELRLYAHGQGYNLTERPFFMKDETMPIKAGMNLTVHPAAVNGTVWATVCDNYLVGPNGPGGCLHKTPKEIIVIS